MEVATTQQFRYDDLYQLIEASGRSQGYVGSGLPVFTSSYRQTFTFNAIGNMLTKTSTSLHSTVHPTGDNLNYTLDYEYIPGTRMAKRIGGMFYAYDADGNLIAEQFGSPPVTGVDGSGRVIRYHEGVFSVDYGFALTNRPPIDIGGSNVFRRDFMWNDRGLLRRSIDRQFDVHYRYGHDGQRALKYSVSGSQHREALYFNRMFTITQMATRDMESKHIFVGNTRIVTKRRQAGHYHVGHEQRMQYFYHGDHLGSVQLVTDWEGNIYEHLEYTPYGELWVDHSVRSVGAYPTVFRFTAHERDPETGFTYAGARYLDPRTSRWISADPAMWEGDYFPRPGQGPEQLGGLGGIFNIVNMHVFHYAGNNPIRYYDPDGRVINLKAAGVGALVGAGIGAVGAIASGGSARDIAAAAAGGAVTGGMAGLTMGGSLAVGMAGSGLAGMAGYGATPIVAGNPATIGGYAISGMAGAAGYAGGQVIARGASVISSRISASQTTTSNVGAVTVIKDNSIINPSRVDASGRTNLSRMENGLAPIGPDGKSVNLHHVNQTMSGPVREMTATSHQMNYRSLHTNTGQGASQIDRNAFDRWRTNTYWPTRANDF